MGDGTVYPEASGAACGWAGLAVCAAALAGAGPTAGADEAAMAWKGHPTHGAIHQQGEAAVYSAFSTEVFELVREARWQRDEAQPAHG